MSKSDGDRGPQLTHPWCDDQEFGRVMAATRGPSRFGRADNSHGTLVPECPCLMCKSPYLPHVLLSVIQSSTPLMNMDSCLAHVRSVSRKKHTEHPHSLDHVQVEAQWLAFDSFSGCQKAQPQIRAKRTWTVTKLESKMGSCKYTH